MWIDLLIDGLIVFLFVALLFAAFLLFRTVLYSRTQEPVPPLELPEIDAEAAAGHLAQALRCQTISDLERSKIDPAPFKELHARLEEMFPLAHAALKRELVNEYSLLYTWQGENLELDPVLFTGHIDVVPVDPTTASAWQQPPFSGAIVDGVIWGRGALDTKCSVVGVLEAVENLLRAGFTPQRTVLLGFGHDEEIGGTQGAAQIAALLQQRGVRLAAVLDEGGAVVDGVFPGLKVPLAMIGVAEKGYLTVELSVEGKPGHSSTPPRQTPIGILGGALARLEANPMPASMGLVSSIFRAVSSDLPLSMRVAFANQWLFGKAIRKKLSANPMTDALMRTSTAITIINGGVKDNILPGVVRAAINFRLMPGDTIADVCNHIRKVVNDERVQLHIPAEKRWEASPVSNPASPVFQLLEFTIRQVFNDVAVTPYLVLGATDARYYAPLSENVYRFSPTLMDAALLNTVHGTDERLPVAGFARMVQFYMQLVRVWGEEKKG